MISYLVPTLFFGPACSLGSIEYQIFILEFWVPSVLGGSTFDWIFKNFYFTYCLLCLHCRHWVELSATLAHLPGQISSFGQFHIARSALVYFCINIVCWLCLCLPFSIFNERSWGGLGATLHWVRISLEYFNHIITLDMSVLNSDIFLSCLCHTSSYLRFFMVLFWSFKLSWLWIDWELNISGLSWRLHKSLI